MDTGKELRTVYAETLIELAEKDERIVLLEADLMKATGTGLFKERFPERLFNVGVAEANMVGVAAGLSAAGKIPFAASFGCFAARRTYDQFFLSANYAGLRVKLTGTDPGVTSAYNGGTHMTFEDTGIMRCIPGLTIFEPADPVSLRQLVAEAALHPGCTYMRLHRKAVPNIYSEKACLKLGRAEIISAGEDLTIIASGSVCLNESLKAAENLKKKGIRAEIIDLHTTKPLDAETVIKSANKTGAVITVENHQIINGLGSAVAEVLSENSPCLLKRIGIMDEFGEVGTQEYLMERFGLTALHIGSEGESLLKKKK